MEELAFLVPGMGCDHCVHAVRDKVSAVPGVSDVRVDLTTKSVVVHGEHLDRPAVFAAVEDAGYEAVTGDF
jgi:copper chaperone CopZ